MAIQAKSTATLSGPFSFISVHDSAVDTEREDFADEWQRYKEGAAEPPLRQGDEPTVFELTPITSTRQLAQLEGVLSEHGQTAWLIATAMSAITGVKNMQAEDGSAFKLKFRRIDGFAVLTDECLDMIPGPVLAEIGMEVINHDTPKKT